MLIHPTLDLLHQLGLNGMAKAFAELEASAEATTLTHPEWLALLLDQEASYRRDRRLAWTRQHLVESASSMACRKSRTRFRRPASIGSNSLSKRWLLVSISDCGKQDVLIWLVMA